MRVILMLYFIGLGFACQGCAPLWQAARSSLVQPLIYRRNTTDILECHRNRELAKAAWKEFVSEHPAEYSKDFESAFKEGYADYLFAGGTGAPPPVPPRRYWNYKYETPQGHKAIQDWFAGFRAGADCARRSGYRELVFVPASTALPSRETQTAQVPPSAQSTAPSTSPSTGTRTEEILPPPRPTSGPDNPATEGLPTLEPLPPPPTSGRLPEENQPMLGPTSEKGDPALVPPPAAEAVPSESGAGNASNGENAWRPISPAEVKTP